MDLLKVGKLLALLEKLPADLREEVESLLAEIDTSDVLRRLGQDFGRGLREGLLNVEEP